eukprot:3870106-Prymnesium_polylepis.1
MSRPRTGVCVCPVSLRQQNSTFLTPFRRDGGAHAVTTHDRCSPARLPCHPTTGEQASSGAPSA